MTPQQNLALGTFHDWLESPPEPMTPLDQFAAAFPDLMAAAMRVLTPQELQQAADDYEKSQQPQDEDEQ